MKTINSIEEMSEVIVFGSGCLDIYNCDADLASKDQLAAFETYCKGSVNNDGQYFECGATKKK